MALFQPSVQKKFIADLDKRLLEAAYQRLLTHFGNPIIQENIRKAKEEQYQEGFLRELFVDVLGYTLNPQPNFNLTTEQKNENNSKKADGAILKNDKVIAVIELKSLKTTNLQVVELQAFNYKNNQKDCPYIITSNFQKIRFYIENAVDFEEFDLFDLSKARFELLYLCLHASNVLSDLPLRIKKASIEKEESITKRLYNDYAAFKNALFKDVSARNKGIAPLTLFKKTQKLLDRFLFIFFAEDKGLLAPNSIIELLNNWEHLKELDAYMPLYQRFKQYFGYLNEGRKSKNQDIFAYNGGLFAPDEVLDKLEITDNLLEVHCRTLSSYDFDTEVDTNILGHIFEHSLNEIDEFEQKTVTKRKKDGIFYTPRYITKHIIESTIGALCQQQKIALHLDNEALTAADTQKDRAIYEAKIKNYRDWLLQLTILDPACGSGAFLNEALVFLMEEHRLIDSMMATVMESTTTFTDNVMDILENNIFGVDINEESVEITRLSLWLRTAKVGRKLNDLSRNIKCGNSLIHNPKIAPEFAFDWEVEFPKIFEKGGFDVVIGNPPYVRHELFYPLEKVWLIKNYKVGSGTSDLYTYFYEKALSILRENGTLGFITPNKFIKAGYGKNLRLYLSGFQIREIIDFGELPVFEEAATFPCIVLIDKKTPQHATQFAKIQSLDFGSVAQAALNTAYSLPPAVFKMADWQMANIDKSPILNKIKLNGVPLEDYTQAGIFRGLLTGFNEAFIIDKPTKDRLIAEDANSATIIKPFLAGDDIRFYQVNFQEKYLIVTKNGIEIEKYPAIFKHLKQYQQQLEKRTDKGKHYWELRACDYYDVFEMPKIIYPDIAKDRRMTLDTKGYFFGNSAYFIPTDDKYLLALLNSKLMFFYYKNISSVLGDADRGGRMRWFKQYVENLPIAIPPDDIKAVISAKAQTMLELTNEYQHAKPLFTNILQSHFPTLQLNKKLESWDKMIYSELYALLLQQDIDIPIKHTLTYRSILDENKAVLRPLEFKIAAIDREINQLVYQLYNLTAEEIQIVEA
jgi:type I restriction-modification system DNA methylase subunit